MGQGEYAQSAAFVDIGQPLQKKANQAENLFNKGRGSQISDI